MREGKEEIKRERWGRKKGRDDVTEESGGPGRVRETLIKADRSSSRLNE